MKLTRRHAILAAAGVSAAGLGTYELAAADEVSDGPFTQRERAMLVTVAEAVYPWELAAAADVLVPYFTRLDDRRTAATRRTLAEFDRLAQSAFGVPLETLSAEEGRTLLRTLGSDRIQSSPTGTLAERVRFHLVNSILFALMTHPSGTAPFDIDNPVGYPGGFASYTEGR